MRDSAFPAGHFHSPIVDPEALSSRRPLIWPERPVVRGIDFNDDGHRRVLTDLFPRFIGQYDYPERLSENATSAAFHTQNSQFTWLDARVLFVLMHTWRPRRIIEVGSGFSSLLIADVNRRWFAGGIEVTCVEPFPRPFLRQPIDGITRLIEREVQSVSTAEFERLEAGDILFIDSSHVAKTGSDVNYLFFEVLPALRPGVYVHVHDIFLPHDYPIDWVLAENRSWNEQYVLRALLMDSSVWRVEFGCSYAFHTFPQLVQQALAHPKGHAFAGGSFWMVKAAP